MVATSQAAPDKTMIVNVILRILSATLRRGPAGWYVQRGERAGKEKPDRMSLPPSLGPDDTDLDLALRLLALPRRVGPHPETGAPFLAGIGC